MGGGGGRNIQNRMLIDMSSTEHAIKNSSRQTQTCKERRHRQGLVCPTRLLVCVSN